MSLASVTITYDIADLVGTDFDARRTKVYATTNVPGEAVIDTVGNQIRIGDGVGTIASDGTGSISLWVPGTGSNPASWQTTIHVDYAQRRPGGRRETRSFGPFTITTAGDLADLIAEQEIPPTYLSEVSGALQSFIDEGEAVRDESVAAGALAAELLEALGLNDFGTGYIVSTDPDDCLVLVGEITPPPAVPGIPTDLTATPGRAEATFTWVTPTYPVDGPITGYRVRYRTVGAASWNIVDTSGLGTTTTVLGLINAVSYEAQVAALNASGASSYSSVVTFSPGLVNGIVMSDDFNRVSADLVGSMPTVGLHPYTGASGQFEVNGSRMAGKSGAAGSLINIDTGARGATTLAYTIRLATLANAAQSGSRVYIKFVDLNNYLYLSIGVTTAGVATYTATIRTAGGAATNLATGFPASTIPGVTAEADYAVSFSLTDLNADGYAERWSITINGTNRTGDLTLSQAQALHPSTQLGFTNTAGNATNIKYDNFSAAVNGTYV